MFARTRTNCCIVNAESTWQKTPKKKQQRYDDISARLISSYAKLYIYFNLQLNELKEIQEFFSFFSLLSEQKTTQEWNNNENWNFEMDWNSRFC